MYRLETSNADWISCNVMSSEAEENTRHLRIIKKMGLRDLKYVPIDLVKGTLQSPRTDSLLLLCMNLLYGGTSYSEKSPLSWKGLKFSFVWWNIETTYEKISSLSVMFYQHFFNRKQFPFSYQLQWELSFLFIISEHVQEFCWYVYYLSIKAWLVK